MNYVVLIYGVYLTNKDFTGYIHSISTVFGCFKMKVIYHRSAGVEVLLSHIEGDVESNWFRIKFINHTFL